MIFTDEKGQEYEEYADSHDFGKSYKVIRPKLEKQETHTYKLQLFSYAPILRNPELDERLTLTPAQASAVVTKIQKVVEDFQKELDNESL